MLNFAACTIFQLQPFSVPICTGVKVMSWSRNCANCINMRLYLLCRLLISAWIVVDTSLGDGSGMPVTELRRGRFTSENKHQPFEDWSTHTLYIKTQFREYIVPPLQAQSWKYKSNDTYVPPADRVSALSWQSGLCDPMISKAKPEVL
jgi:hypothetical protein